MKNEEIVRNADISENFTIVGNNIIKDSRLSIESRFVLIFMRSFKKGWVFYKKDLQERLNIGRRVIDRCFEELSEVGYLLETELIRNGALFPTKGYTVYPYSIKDEPITLYSTDVQNVQRENSDSSITQDLSDVQNVQGDASSRVQNVHLINTNINTYNTAPSPNSSSPINPVKDTLEHRLDGGPAAAAPAEIDYRGLDESAKLWLEYKAEKKSKYRGPKSIQIMINQLWKKSNGNPERAMDIVENSIANNYQGLFEARENATKQQEQPVIANSNVKFNIQ
jgi:hypothetical protein